jgi:hypothetical protein
MSWGEQLHSYFLPASGGSLFIIWGTVQKSLAILWGQASHRTSQKLSIALNDALFDGGK